MTRAVVALSMVSTIALADSPTEPVEVELIGPGEYSLELNANDIEYVELEQSVFVLGGDTASFAADPIYLVPDLETVGSADELVLPLPSGERDADKIVSLPIPITLGAGVYCEKVRLSVILAARQPRSYGRRQCFNVDAAGAAQPLSEAELFKIQHPLTKSVNARGEVELVIDAATSTTPSGGIYDATNPAPREITFATPLHVAGKDIEHVDTATDEEDAQ